MTLSFLKVLVNTWARVRQATTGQRALLVITVCIVNLLVVAVAVTYLWSARQSLEARASRDAENLTKLTAKNIESEVARIDLALRMVVSEIEADGGIAKTPEPASMRRFNSVELNAQGTAPAMRTEDAAGVIVAGPGFDKSKIASVAERDYYLKLKGDPRISFAVGESVLGRLSKKWIVPFARSVKGPHGEFAGLITVSVPVELFQSQSMLSIHEDSLFLLMDANRRVVSRVTRDTPQIGDFGKVLTGPTAMKAVAAKKSFVGGEHFVSTLDSIDRVTAIQRLEATPWFVIVGVPWAGYEAIWYRDLAVVLVMVTVFFLVSTVLACYLRRGMTQQLSDMDHIEFLAYHDVLTELPNRKLLRDRFSQALSHARREERKFALLYLDLDHFKEVNDSLGHEAGDALLKQIALRLKSCVREGDTVSRQGGDEFLVLLSNLASAEAATLVVSQIMQSLNSPIIVDGNELLVSTSVGLAIYPDDGQDFDTLRKNADVAMYQAKDQGRNGYCFFDGAMNASAHERLEMTNALKRALDRNEFILHYQPQIDLKTNALIGVEALIRWNHPQYGMVPPGRFIPLAEQSGLIVPIGAWVLEEACRQAVEWQKSGTRPFTVAVNLSAAQFKRGKIEDTVVHALSVSGLSPNWLELELTESILMNDTLEVLATVKRLKAMGVVLSIDDFGTGYSSLSYLKSFKVDKLKIDQSFTRGMSTHPEDKAIINAIIQLALSLQFKTIAEGVETPQELNLLKELGCDEAQGYHVARPMAADKLIEFLNQNRHGVPAKKFDGQQHGAQEAPLSQLA